MQKFLLPLVLLLMTPFVQAAIKFTIKDEQGNTNWQYVANWSSGILIILLTIIAIWLFLTKRREKKANHELNVIRKELEQRVKDRTATLDESNRLLQESNQLLAQEVEQHVNTTSRLRVSESYIKDILTSMPLMLISLDKEGRVTQWNRRVAEASGISPDDALGRNLWEVYPSATIQPETVQQAIRENRTIHLKQSLRSVSHFDITIYPLRDADHPGVVILVDDVSKQITAENMLIHNDKMSFMGELASTMAHDINAPLQAILLDLKSFQGILSQHDFIKDEADKEKVAKLEALLADMSEKGTQVSTITNNLVAFARSQHQGKQQANVIDVMESAVGVANDVISSDSFTFRDLKIERDFEENLPVLPCYITELQQVLLSLFRHAMRSISARAAQASGPYEPKIKLMLSECYDSLWIRVQHNGIGLTHEEQMHLFEPFFSQDGESEDHDAGGRLSFSHYIITEQHRGNMAVTSDVEIGSTFHIQLPLAD